MRQVDTGTMKRFYEYDTTEKSDVILFEGRSMPKVHPSSRVYRSIYDFSQFSPKATAAIDASLFWFYCLQNPRLLYINRPMSVYNFTGEGIYSGINRKKQRLMQLRNLTTLNEGLNYKYEDFVYTRFKKALMRRHRPLFALIYFFSKNRAYETLIKKYAQP